MTKNKTTKKTTKKSTSSHSSKVAQKTVKAKALKLPKELQKNYYSEKTLTEIFSVGKGLIKTFENAEKKSVSQKISLIKLTVQMITEAKKNNLVLSKDQLRNALYHFTGYDKSKQLHSFVMAMKRIIDASMTLFENPKFSIDEKTAQILDAKKKVLSVKNMDKKNKTRNRDTKKNEVSTLSEATQAIDYLNNNPRFFIELDIEKLELLILNASEAFEKRTTEATEKANPQMAGKAKMPTAINF
tara:strand:+ start:1341 stop:2069 length:729 start_codon:yes stop_codon:yes gene_type:complete